MCGIIGYTGKERAVPYLIEGLRALEYRGYDSAGLALTAPDRIDTVKAEGRLNVLESVLASEKQREAKSGIGHTRWATHGSPSIKNCHPHLSRNGKFAVVHNGIIENYAELKAELIRDGFRFLSDTDTEVIPHLFEKYYNGDLLRTATLVRKRLIGAYALCIMCTDYPDEILCLRFGSPLVAGQGEKGAFIASDVIALSGVVQYIYKPSPDELIVLKDGGVHFYNSNLEPFYPSMTRLSLKPSSAAKTGYSHYMLKEINEQSAAVADTIFPFIKNNDIIFPDFDISRCSFESIRLIGCGSAYNAALSGRYFFEENCPCPVSADIASEFRYRDIELSEKDLCIFISQSGETADTLSALKLAKEKGCTTLGIVNVKESSVADLSDYVIYTAAGPEIAVATTKAYSCQLALLCLLSVYIGSFKGKLTVKLKQEYTNVLLGLPPLIKRTVSISADKMRRLSEYFTEKEHAYFMGRGHDYPIAAEAALKLKEISYIHAEAFPAGELKHGMISLIEAGTTLVCLMADNRLFSKTLNNVKEAQSRGATVIAVATEDKKALLKDTDRQIFIPHCHSLIAPCLEIIPLQLLSYFTAINKNCDVDKPRNLAKSVTVE